MAPLKYDLTSMTTTTSTTWVIRVIRERPMAWPRVDNEGKTIPVSRVLAIKEEKVRKDSILRDASLSGEAYHDRSCSVIYNHERLLSDDHKLVLQ